MESTRISKPPPTGISIEVAQRPELLFGFLGKLDFLTVILAGREVAKSENRPQLPVELREDLRILEAKIPRLPGVLEEFDEAALGRISTFSGEEVGILVDRFSGEVTVNYDHM